MKALQVIVFDDVEFKRTGQRVEATQTAVLGWKGEWREIDLTDENYKLLFEQIKRFFYAGHQAGEDIAPPRSHPGGSYSYFKNMRDWADQQGRSSEYRLKGKGSGYSYDRKLRHDYAAHLSALAKK